METQRLGSMRLYGFDIIDRTARPDVDNDVLKVADAATHDSIILQRTV